jgi:FkbM family methyltransferase
MIRQWKTQLLNFTRKQLFQNPVAEATLRNLTQGRKADDWICRIVPNHYQYPSPSLRTVRVGDGSLEWDLSDFIEWHSYFDFFDPSLDRLLKLCKPGDHVFDIGANIGAMTLKLSEKVSNEGKVYSFEPDSQRFQKCLKQIQLSHRTNINCYPLALGDKTESRELRIRNSLNQGMNQIVPAGIVEKGASPVKVITLDEFVKEHQVARIHLIKIDVEGFEYKVLSGAVETLARFRPVLYIEIDTKNLSDHGNRPVEIFNLLKNQGYEFSQTSNDNCHFDLIATPKPL